MSGLWPGERLTRGLERVVLSAVQLLLMALIVLAVLDLIYLMWLGVTTRMPTIDSADEFQKALQNGFAGILLVLIGLELLETVRAYLQDHRVRLEVVLIVAIIALGRHIIQLDLSHLDGVSLLGVAALMMALTTSYFLTHRIASAHRPQGAASMSDSNPEESPR
jgi:uncharacterized membrane protein (DUF373 family)